MSSGRGEGDRSNGETRGAEGRRQKRGEEAGSYASGVESVGGKHSETERLPSIQIIILAIVRERDTDGEIKEKLNRRCTEDRRDGGDISSMGRWCH